MSELTQRMRVSPDSLWTGLRAVARVLEASGAAGGHVVLAEPTSSQLTAEILAAGARYVDCGRNHRFEIDADGWRLALAGRQTRVAWLGAPDLPTGLMPAPDRIREAQEAGVPVVLDEREAWDPMRSCAQADQITLRRLGTDIEMVVGPPLVIAQLGPSTVSELDERWMRELDAQKALATVLFETASTIEGLVPTPPSGPGLWVRVPGVPSAVSAKRAGVGVDGSTDWTWRDAVRIVSMEGLERLADSLPGNK